MEICFMNSLVMPIRRNLKFQLPRNKVATWNGAGLHVSQFLNTMSLFFPEGERFFIQSVRNYRDQITDPAMKEAVTAFIGQEAMHGREHTEYNDCMVEAGFPVDKMEKQVTRLLAFFQKNTPKAFQLAGTIALEHLTAILANSLLQHPELLKDSDPHFTALWQWHALEETEHKAVAFDVYRTVMGKNIGAYALRTSTLVFATSIFFAICYTYYFQIIKKSNEHKNMKGWWTAFKHQWLKPGVLRASVPAWLDYFKPGFHPWDHNNRHFLEQVDELVARVDAFSADAA
jgi:predicted metal-dependent hydrolase